MGEGLFYLGVMLFPLFVIPARAQLTAATDPTISASNTPDHPAAPVGAKNPCSSPYSKCVKSTPPKIDDELNRLSTSALEQKPNASAEDASRPTLRLQWSPWQPQSDPVRVPPAGAASSGGLDLRSSFESTHGEIPTVSEPDPKESSVAEEDRVAAKSALSQARSALAAGDFSAADRAASKSLDYNPEDHAALSLQSQIANQLGDFPRAEDLARSSVQIKPSAEAYQSLAWAEVKEGKLEQALDAAKKALELDPQSGVGRDVRAYVEEALGRRTAALGDSKNVPERDARLKDNLAAASDGGSIRDPHGRDVSSFPEASTGDRSPAAPNSDGWILAALLLTAASGAAGFFWLRPAEAIKVAASSLPVPRGSALRRPQEALNRKVGKYEIGRVIGRGGMGVVYEAMDRILARQVAIKKMSPTVAALGPQWRESYIKEARIVASLHHPAIVEIFDIVEQDEDIYLVFEFVKGITAHQLLIDRGPLSLEKTAEILRPICDALKFAHGRRLVHRDLKPMNIMVTEDGPAKLMDFGIARILSGGPDQTRTQTVRGTPIYMAPESWEGVVRVESDIYSLGICLYELVTGTLPFVNPMAPRRSGGFELPSARIAGLPSALDELLLRALEPDPNRRIRSAADFIGRLEAAVNSEAKTPV